MLKLLIITPDNPLQPCGGCGIHYREIIPHLQKEFNLLATLALSPGEGYIGETPVFFVDTDLIQIKEKNYYIWNALTSSIVEQYVDVVGKPDIVICSDHSTIMPAVSLAAHYKAHLVVMFELALYSYQKMYNPEKLNPTNKVLSDTMNAIEEYAMKVADRLYPVSQAYYDDLPEQYKEIARVMPNGINLENFQNLKPCKFPGDFKYNLLYAGRFNTQKGIEAMLKLKLPKDTALFFMGPERGSDYWKEVMQAVLVNPQMFYVGHVFDNKRFRVMKQASAMLFPSLHEPFGIIGLEAMACKTPLITTLADGIKTYMSEDRCFKCEPTAESLLDAINCFRETPKERLQEIVDKNYEVVQQFQWNMLCENMAKDLKEVVKSPRRNLRSPIVLPPKSP